MKIASAQIDNGGVACGVLAGELIDAVTIKTSAFTFDPNDPADQALGDFHMQR